MGWDDPGRRGDRPRRQRGVNRVWFFDLSAGPEAWGGNYDITNADLDGDGEADYRIPVSWEYASNGYRSPALMASDLSKVARFSALNMLFNSSPLYPPYLTPELLPTGINLDVNTYEGWPGVDASQQYVRPDYLRKEESELFPSSLVGRPAGPAVHGQGAGVLRAVAPGRPLLREPAAVPG